MPSWPISREIIPVLDVYVWCKDPSLFAGQTACLSTHKCVYMRASEGSFEAEEVESEAVGDIVQLTRYTFSRPEFCCPVDEGFQETKTPHTSQ
jgi:hypothetical protein